MRTMGDYSLAAPAALYGLSWTGSIVPSPVPPVGIAEAFVGTTGNDHFIGSTDSDTFDLTQGGNDKAAGKAGNDTFDLGAAFTARDHIDGGDDTFSVFPLPSPGDVVHLDGDYSAGVVLGATTLTNVEALQLSGGPYNLTLNDGNVAAGTFMIVDGANSDESIIVDGSAETDGDLALAGGSGNDILTGGPSNDSFSSGGGTDVIDGGGGYNLLTFFNGFSGITVSLALQGTPQDVGGATITMTNIQAVIGTFGDDVFTGDGNTNYFNSITGSDDVDGAVGDDYLQLAAQSGDLVKVDGGDGNDTIIFSYSSPGITFSLAEHGFQNTGAGGGVKASGIENLAGALGLPDDLIGDGHDNILAGDSGSDILEGGRGADVLYGDKTFGPLVTDIAYVGASGIGLKDAASAGIDTLVGGRGNDTLNGGLAGDTMTGGKGNDIYAYEDVEDSTSVGYDIITGFDPDAHDTFHLQVSVAGVDPTIGSGTLTNANFDNDVAFAVDGAHLAAGHAVVFDADSGDQAGTYLIIDANGTAGYQAGEDFVLRLDDAHHLSALDTTDVVTG